MNLQKNTDVVYIAELLYQVHAVYAETRPDICQAGKRKLVQNLPHFCDLKLFSYSVVVI